MEYGILLDLSFLLLTLTGSVLQVYALVSANWWVVDEKLPSGQVVEEHFGVWFTSICLNGTCERSASDRAGAKAWLRGVAVVETIAAVLLGLATLVQVYLLIKAQKNQLIRKLYVVLSVGAGGVIIVGILIFVKKKAGLVLNEAALQTKDGSSSLALVFSSISSGLAVVLGVVMGVCIVTVFAESKDYDEGGVTKVHQWEDKRKTLEIIDKPENGTWERRDDQNMKNTKVFSEKQMELTHI